MNLSLPPVFRGAAVWKDALSGSQDCFKKGLTAGVREGEDRPTTFKAFGAAVTLLLRDKVAIWRMQLDAILPLPCLKRILAIQLSRGYKWGFTHTIAAKSFFFFF
jgi:hypothetical protein